MTEHQRTQTGPPPTIEQRLLWHAERQTDLLKSIDWIIKAFLGLALMGLVLFVIGISA